jgi:4-carboxymuconolactone decarboxylase
MSRITPVFKPSDYPDPDEQTRQDLAELFEAIAPGVAQPEIDKPHTGMAIAAHNPKFALNLSRLTTHVALGLDWGQRKDLFELAVQAVNLHFKCDFSFATRMAKADASGLGMERLAALPYWRTSSLFDDEQRLVAEFVESTISGDVADELLVRAKARWGEKGVVELTAVIGTFSLWAMLINAGRPRF